MTNNRLHAMRLLDEATRKVRDLALASTFDMIADSPESIPRNIDHALIPAFEMLADDAADDPASNPLTATEFEDLERLVARITERLDHADIARLLSPVHR